MAAYEDDFAYTGQFVRYFPTYETMDTRQLRGYFTWRTNVRRGDVQPCPLSFVYVWRVRVAQPEPATSLPRRAMKAARVLADLPRIRAGAGPLSARLAATTSSHYGLDKSLLHGPTGHGIRRSAAGAAKRQRSGAL